MWLLLSIKNTKYISFTITDEKKISISTGINYILINFCNNDYWIKVLKCLIIYNKETPQYVIGFIIDSLNNIRRVLWNKRWFIQDKVFLKLNVIDIIKVVFHIIWYIAYVYSIHHPVRWAIDYLDENSICYIGVTVLMEHSKFW